MGAHSSLIISQGDARRIWRELVQPEDVPSFKEMERFFDKATDQALYNVCIYSFSSEDVETSASLVENYVKEYLEANPAERPTSPANENRILRELLACRVAGGAGLYTDDGELQDNTVHPCIDFKRDSAQEIQRKLRVRAFNQLQEASQNG